MVSDVGYVDNTIVVDEVSDKRGILEFIKLPWVLYKDDNYWVPPIISQQYRTLTGHNNPLLQKNPHAFLIARRNSSPVGRLLIGINSDLNAFSGKSDGFFSLFEAADDEDVVASLFSAASAWFKSKGVTAIVGPISPTNGDDGRGILTKGFDCLPVMLNNYNPQYYEALILKCGFTKYMDFYAYRIDVANLDVERYGRVVEFAMKKYGFRIDRIDAKKFDRETRDLKTIIDLATPDTWTHVTRATMDDVRRMAQSLRSIMDEDLVYIARVGDEPIGFVAALPDYNPILKEVNGRLFPFGFLKLLGAKRRVTGGRVIMQFVVPRFRNKAVNGAIFYKLMIAANAKGYTYGEGSTIAEWNVESMRSVENAGGHLYRIYRLYQKPV